MLPPKAESVDAQGARDGFSPPAQYRPEIVGPGHTRLTVSVPPDQLGPVHRALVATLDPPLRVLYKRLTDRSTGQLDKPEHLVGLELSREQVMEALNQCGRLAYHDGRHELWIQSRGEAKIVMEETGVLYVYPDDPSFRDILQSQGIDEGNAQDMAARNYVRVNFLAEADAEESTLIERLGLRRWERG